MFKQLEQWMEELEEELLIAYRRAAYAQECWREGLHRMYNKANIAFYHVMDTFASRYNGYCVTHITPRAKEVFAGECEGVPFYALVDELEIDNKVYSKVIAFGRVKDAADTKVHYSAMRALQKTFEDRLSSECGYIAFLRDRQVYAADVALVDGRDDAWMVARAHKDMLQKKKAIEDKIKKICEDIDTINDEHGEIYVKGTNGRIAHIWRIIAGGWRIQRIHNRVLCKEVKVK